MTPIEIETAARDQELRQAVAAVRRHWRTRILVEGACIVALTVVGAVLVGAALSALLGPGSGTATTVRVVGYLLIAASAARFLVAPWIRRVDDEQIALYVEEHDPALRQTLLSAVHELARPLAERASPALAARVMARAVDAVGRLDRGAVIERGRLRRATAGLAGAALAAVLLGAFGPALLRDVARVLFVPWSEAEAAPILAVGVSPGHVSVPRGAGLDIQATLTGFSAPAAELVMKRDSGDADWIRIPMLRDSTGTGFTVRLFDLVRATDYFVEAEGVSSATFRITVTNLPAVRRVGLELRFPTHTGLPVERIPDGGDVAALVGTQVTVRASVTLPVAGGALRFDDGTTVPLAQEGDSAVTAVFRVTRDGGYRIDLQAPDGALVPGSVQYTVVALADQPPIVRIDEPGRDTRATAVEEVTVSVRAADDYGIAGVELRYSVNGGEERRVSIAGNTTRGTTDLRGAHTFFLEELGLAPGDLVAYHAAATDGGGNTATSDIYFLEIRPFSRNYRQAEQGGGGGGGGGGGQQSPEGLSARQREIVAGTFNWVRDSARTTERERRENLTTLAIAQGRIKEDVAQLAQRIDERNVAATDTLFRIIKAELDTAVRDMQAAEEALGLGRAPAAIPPEQRALQRLQRAEAAYRDVQVQMGGQQGGGGGGGGGSSRAEDLADLFELETDRMRNQYEAVQREASNQAQEEVDELRERLRQLAARQQQESERMRQMADALRDRIGQESAGSGGGSAQRELARQAEEEARRLERLSRERNSPELAEAARQLQQAAEAMRRAASGSDAQAQAALERLQRAAEGMDNARASDTQEAIRDLERRARDLGRRQDDIQSDVEQLQGASGADRAERLRRLDERKDALAGEVDRLQADAERTARDARREQPRAAAGLEGAASEIRDSRLRDRITYSKGVARSGSPEYAREFEGQISDYLDSVAERFQQAAGAVGESTERSQQRALDRVRDLVRGMESLRERMGQGAAQQDSGAAGQPAEGQGAGQPGPSGQPGQPGQSGQQGQAGQQGQPGQPGQQGQAGQAGQQGQTGQGGERGTGEQQQPGGGQDREGMIGGTAPRTAAGGDARQFAREWQLRRQAAEELRRDLRDQGVETPELDRIIADMRRFERPLNDPRGLAELQAAMIERMKTFEFTLWRRFNANAEGGPALGSSGQVPPEYRALVEEYYRSLARPRN